MKIMKYSLLLGVASAFLLSGHLSAATAVLNPSEFPEFGNQFGANESGSNYETESNDSLGSSVNSSDSYDAGEKPTLPATNEVNNEVNAEPVVELPKADIDNALDALAKAKAALEDTQRKAEEQDQAKQAEIAAKKKAEEDAAEHERLKKLTPEDHRKAAEETVLANNQHKYATFLGMEDGAVNLDSTHENEVNAAQAEELKKIGIGTDITTKIAGQEAVASPNAEAVAESESATTAVNAGADEEKADKQEDTAAETPANVDQQDQTAPNAEKQESNVSAADQQNEAAANGKKAKKPRKKLNDEEKAAHEERMKKQKEDSEAKKAKKKADNAQKKDDQIKDKDKKGEKRKKKQQKEEQIAKKKEEGKAKKAERKARREENKNKDYTELLNEGESPQEIDQSN